MVSCDLRGPNRPTRSVTFSAEVNENGEFDIWLPGIDLAIGDVVVVGDVLLSAASFVDGWCGVAAGAVTQPFESISRDLRFVHCGGTWD